MAVCAHTWTDSRLYFVWAPHLVNRNGVEMVVQICSFGEHDKMDKGTYECDGSKEPQ